MRKMLRKRKEDVGARAESWMVSAPSKRALFLCEAL